MKMPRADRDNVISRGNTICVGLTKKDKELLTVKAQEMGISNSAFVRIALKEYMRKN